MMILGGLAFIQGNFIGGMWWFLIGSFLRSAAITSYRQLLVRKMLSDKPVRRFMNDEPVTVTPDITIETLQEEYVKQHHFSLYPVVEGNKLIGCITAREIEKVSEEERAQKTVGDLLSVCSAANTVSPDTDAIKLVTEMSVPMPIPFIWSWRVSAWSE